jgi:hypothetical protein
MQTPKRISVRVPQGAIPGQTIGATTPDGQRLVVTVPPNAVVGSVLNISYMTTAEPGSPHDYKESRLAVTVPVGLGPERQMFIKSPEGMKLQVTVPPGHEAGSKFVFKYKLPLSEAEQVRCPYIPDTQLTVYILYRFAD